MVENYRIALNVYYLNEPAIQKLLDKIVGTISTWVAGLILNVGIY